MSEFLININHYPLHFSIHPDGLLESAQIQMHVNLKSLISTPDNHRTHNLLEYIQIIFKSWSCSCCCWVESVRPHRQQPTRLPRPWDSPGKNTGVGCHFLLQCMIVKSESEVAQSCPTLHDPMDCSPPGSSVHGVFQARVLEWVAIAFSIYSPNKTQKWCILSF